MEENLKKLLLKFNKICLKRWIRGVNNDISGVGLTLENELNKEVDSDLFPDFYNIELKSTQRYSGYPISLFNKTLDGPRIFETKYLVDKYGNDYFNGSDKKYLFVNLVHGKKVLVNEKYYFELFLSIRDKKMYIYIFDLKNNLLDTSYIDFISIEDHLSVKLSNLALVYASKRKVDSNNYFRYYKLNFYKLISIDKFYYLIQNNVIKISIICRASFSKKNIGKQKNKGINFKIFKDDLEKLFDKIFEYNADDKTFLINSEFIFNDYDILSLGDDFEKEKHLAK